jgi:hypothetical protein
MLGEQREGMNIYIDRYIYIYIMIGALSDRNTILLFPIVRCFCSPSHVRWLHSLKAMLDGYVH